MESVILKAMELKSKVRYGKKEKSCQRRWRVWRQKRTEGGLLLESVGVLMFQHFWGLKSQTPCSKAAATNNSVQSQRFKWLPCRQRPGSDNINNNGTKLEKFSQFRVNHNARHWAYCCLSEMIKRSTNHSPGRHKTQSSQLAHQTHTSSSSFVFPFYIHCFFHQEWGFTLILSPTKIQIKLSASLPRRSMRPASR